MRLRFVDVAVCIVSLLTLGGVLLFAAEEIRSTDLKLVCARNLREIGQALLLYSRENKGQFPRTVFDRADDPLPVWGTPYTPKDRRDRTADPFAGRWQVKPNDVTAALYLLVREEEAQPSIFVCPASSADAFDFRSADSRGSEWTNWPGDEGIARHLSYSYQNPYPSKAAIANGFRMNNSIDGDFALAADINPGTAGVLTIDKHSKPDALREASSPNHLGDGQNVLYADGHVQFCDSPLVGRDGDNIYTFGDRGGIVGAPVAAGDNVLLPTAKDVGLIDDRRQFTTAYRFKSPTAEQAAVLNKAVQGQYTRDERELGVLRIGDGTLTAGGNALTASYRFAITACLDDQTLRCTVTPPIGEAEAIRVNILPDGVSIAGNPYIRGTWHRKPADHP